MDRETWRREFAAELARHAKPAPADGQGVDLLRLLAADPASGLHELAPGVWAVDRGVDGPSAR